MLIEKQYLEGNLKSCVKIPKVLVYSFRVVWQRVCEDIPLALATWPRAFFWYGKVVGYSPRSGTAGETYQNLNRDKPSNDNNCPRPYRKARGNWTSCWSSVLPTYWDISHPSLLSAQLELVKVYASSMMLRSWGRGVM